MNGMDGDELWSDVEYVSAMEVGQANLIGLSSYRAVKLALVIQSGIALAQEADISLSQHISISCIRI